MQEPLCLPAAAVRRDMGVLGVELGFVMWRPKDIWWERTNRTASHVCAYSLVHYTCAGV